MNNFFQSVILEATGASGIVETTTIQSLWSGYGKIIRVQLADAVRKSVVVKLVQLPEERNHPRGWNTDIGHQRKLKSYQVETEWYAHYAQRSKARLPQCLALESQEEKVLMVLEDLDEAGFPLRKESVSWIEVSACLRWLAQFHASFLGQEPEGLWKKGTYWQLETRPQELEALSDLPLKKAAQLIDQKLDSCQYLTLVHGDAKLANFCFSKNERVAAVDFQYVGGGCGMKDVAYFIGSCLPEKECEELEEKILHTYFLALATAMGEKNEALEREWREMYRYAWADFHRFLKGWSPGHWKINSYSERITKEVINKLGHGSTGTL